MPVLGLSAATFTTAATAATVTTATTAAASAAASAALTATLTSIATNVAINIALSTALSLLQPNVGTAGRTFEWTLDPDGPIPFAAGRVGIAGSVVYRRTFGAELMYYGIPSVLSGAGPIDGFEGFMADDEVVTFDATGKAITSQYKGELWYRNSFGSQPDTALVSPAGLKDNVKLIGWTAANRLSGKASYLIVMGENSKGTAYPTGEIKPLITLRGLKGWDPRQDSTYPGGSGPCRLHDPSTWVYITNPILWALKWSLGLWEGPTGKGAPQVDYQVGGIGAKLSGIDVPAFVSAANVADANGWTVAAYPTTDDDKGQVLDAFLQAGGAIYAQRAGKISCIQRAAPRASIVTISAADTAGPLEIDTAASRIDRINTIRPRFWSEAHRWQMTALPEVTAAAYQTEDGGKRTRGLDLHYVSNATQAAQLAALQIANTREGIAGVIPLKPHLQRIRPGDAFTITEPGFVLNGLKCLCLNTDYDPATGVVRVSFASETDAKYAFAMGQSPTPPAPPVLTPVDHTLVSPPLPSDWTIVVRPPAPGGVVPGFDLSGAVGNSTATAIEVQYWVVPEGADPAIPPAKDAPEWKSAGTWPPTVSTIPIDVEGGRYYWIGLIHIRNQNYSEMTLVGPRLAEKLIAGGISDETRDDIVQDVLGQVGDIAAGTEAAEQLAEVVLETILNEQDALEAEARDRLAADTGVLQEARVYTDDAKAWVDLTFYTRAATDAGFASTLQVAKSYTDDKQSEATLLFSTKAERASGDAVAVLQAKAYTDDFKSEASLTYATQAAMGSGLAATLSSAQSYTNGQVATAMNTVYTKAQTDSGLSTTLQQAKTYSDGKASEASLLFATKAERENGDAATYASMKSYVDAYKSEANLTFAAQSSLNGVSATAALALSSAVDAQTQLGEASFSVVAAAGGDPAVIYAKAKGSTSVAGMIASVLRFANTVGGATVEAMRLVAGEVFFMRPIYIDVGSRRLIVGPGSDWVMWFGPNTTTAASATRTNGHWAFGSDGKVYYGSSELNTGGGGFHAQSDFAVRIGTRTSPGTVTTSTVTITTSGATGAVSYAWSQISGDDTWSVTSASGAATTFKANVSTAGEQKRAAFVCRVEDAGSGKAMNITVAAAAIYNI